MQGSLAPSGNGVAIAMQSFAYQRPGVDVALASPTTIAVAGGSARFEQTTLKTGGGSVVLSGQVGGNIDLTANLNAVPVGAGEFLQAGSRGRGHGVGHSHRQGDGGRSERDVQDRLRQRFRHRVPQRWPRPARHLRRWHPRRQDAEPQKPNERRRQPCRSMSRGRIGTAPGAPLNLKITGNVPLALGNAQLASRGAALQGALKLDVAVSGTAAAPKFSGRVTSEGGGFVDPETGIVLKDLRLAATVSGDRIVIEQLNATSGGGTVSAMGSVGLDPNAGFPVEIGVQSPPGALRRRHARRLAFRRRPEALGQLCGRAAAQRDSVPRPHRGDRAGAAAARFRRGRCRACRAPAAGEGDAGERPPTRRT